MMDSYEGENEIVKAKIDSYQRKRAKHLNPITLKGD